MNVLGDGDSNFQLFNLATMSGVFPGTRTQMFQRLRLQPLAGAQPETVWAQALWYTDPSACVIYIQPPAKAAPELTPLLRIAEPLAGDFNQEIRTALHQAGWQVQSCGSCRFWQGLNSASPDGLPTGRCTWSDKASTTPASPLSLATQANLALSCAHWQVVGEAKNLAPTAEQTLAPVRKAAELSESKQPYWVRLYKQMIRLGKPFVQPQNSAETLLERSGVGAGTEACFACEGRIANLGALAVETVEGDKQTFSVWRCRNCYTTYLNNWIDRWERLESLETEETYYRIAPAEALALLLVFEKVTGGDHPGRRRERNAERAQILNYVAGRTPLSYQVKLGR